MTPEIESLVVFAIPDIPWKFQKDPSITFWVILLTDRQTNSGKNNLLGGSNKLSNKNKLGHYYGSPCLRQTDKVKLQTTHVCIHRTTQIPTQQTLILTFKEFVRLRLGDSGSYQQFVWHFMSGRWQHLTSGKSYFNLNRQKLEKHISLVYNGKTNAYVSMVLSRASLLIMSSCPEVICSRLRRIISHRDWAAFVCFCNTHSDKRLDVFQHYATSDQAD